MRIFGRLPWPTISPVTVTLARAAASLVTVSPSTSRIAGRVTVSPASPVRRFTVNRSPTATLCWLPPAFTTAYTTDSSFLATLFDSRAHDRFGHRVLRRARTPARRHPEVRSRWRCNPTSVPERRRAGRSGLDRRAGRPAGRPAAPRPRCRRDLGLGLRCDLGLGLRLDLRFDLRFDLRLGGDRRGDLGLVG